MKLYYADTIAPRKCCALAKHLKSPVEFVPVDLHKGEHRQPDYLAINPNGKVPALVDGQRRLWEADAILCYLAQQVESELWPMDARQVEIQRWLSWNAHHFFHHAGTLYFEYLIRPRFDLGPVDEKAVEEALGNVRIYGRVLNDHLRDKRYLLGDSLTIADFSVAVPLPYAEAARIPLDEFPAVRRWHERLNELEAWREPFPLPAEASA